MYRAECPNCGKVVELRQGPLEQIVSCPECHTCLTIPPDPSLVNTVLPPSENDKKRNTVPWRYILAGMALPLIAMAMGYICFILFPFYKGYLITLVGITIYLCLFGLSIVVYPIYVFRRLKRESLFKKITFLSMLKELLISFLFFVLIGLVYYFLADPLIRLFKGKVPVTNLQLWLEDGNHCWLKLALLLPAIILVSTAEEVYFRGFLYTSLKTRMRLIWALFLQAGFFSFLHMYNLTGTVWIFMVGVFLVIVYEIRKNLYAPVFVHVFTNVSFVFIYLGVGFLNIHAPAQTWDQARQPPEWLSQIPPAYVERQDTAEAQRLYAIETWGSQGWHLWKREANAFRAVEYWFPEQTEPCAMARNGIIYIYFYYLRDYRRVVIEAENLMELYPQHREICASAMLNKAWALYYLDDFDRSKDTAEYVLAEFSEFESMKENIEQLLEILKQTEDDSEEWLENFVGKAVNREE